MFIHLQKDGNGKETRRNKYKIDMNKSRKNAVYYSQYDYPLFTVMDEVQIFKPFISSYSDPDYIMQKPTNTFL